MSTNFSLSVLLAGAAAFAATCLFQTNLMATQLRAPEQLRGRVLSVRFVTWGLQPVSMLAIGGVAEAAGPQIALTAFALGGIAAFALVNLFFKSDGRREVSDAGRSAGHTQEVSGVPAVRRTG
ncbi:MAG: hypothetical protein HY682_09060 [Chloroflexi bacterium]|nr:hypothetical protein [Chloroflexota bacterium]